MKKTMSVLLCAAILLGIMLSLTACGNSGTYVLTSVKMGNVTYDINDLKDLGTDFGLNTNCYIELKSDGTGSLNLFGGITDIQWDDECIWPADNKNNTTPYRIEDGVLYYEIDNVVLLDQLIFTKE